MIQGALATTRQAAQHSSNTTATETEVQPLLNVTNPAGAKREPGAAEAELEVGEEATLAAVMHASCEVSALLCKPC